MITLVPDKVTMLQLARHTLKNLALLCLSLALLPLDTAIVLAVSIWHRLAGKTQQDHAKVPEPLRKTVLVTGVSMSKGLALARLFHRAGHRVIGADSHRLAPGRVSATLEAFYRLPPPRKTPFGDDDEIEDDPYALALLDIVKKEKVDLWVSVSDVTAVVQDALAKDMIESQTPAKAVQLSAKYVRTLHNKDSFMEYTRHLELPAPDTEVVRGKSAIIDFLNKRGGLRAHPGANRYLLRRNGVHDAARCDMPLLPLATEQETLRCIEKMTLEDGDEYMMQEYLQGHEFCTHALVVRGRVRAFVACPSSDTLMHYQALPPESPLSRFMLAFTETIAETEGEDFTGHVSFDFMAKTWSGGDSKHEDVHVFPIECKPRVHTAVVLFNDTPELVGEYLSLLQPEPPIPEEVTPVVVPKNPKSYYWIGQDLVQHFLSPTLESLSRDPRDGRRAGEVSSFLNHVRNWRNWRNWKDGTFEVWDPWPWWWLYHVYWPVQFVKYLVWGRWQKLNVSTGKAFQAR